MVIPLLQEFKLYAKLGIHIAVKKPERPCYDLTAFRQLALPQVDFHKSSHEVVLNERDVSRSREKLK